MNQTLIEVKVHDHIAILKLNRPEKRNAMSDAMRSELVAALESIAHDAGVRAMVLTGEGKSFCAGGDIEGMKKRLQSPIGEVAFNGWSRQQKVHHAQTLLYTMPKPTIAAVNGSANGLGADLALACDFVMASDAASFTWSYIHRGLIPDGGGMYFLPRRVGLPQAKRIIFSGAALRLDEALRLGIVDRAAGADNLLQEALAWATELSQGPAHALALGKSILNQSFESDVHQIFALGSQAQGMCYTSAFHQESVATFLAKTPSKE